MKAFREDEWTLLTGDRTRAFGSHLSNTLSIVIQYTYNSLYGEALSENNYMKARQTT